MKHAFADWDFPDKTRREDQILAHALDVVRESGLASLTMKKVAERVGFTEAAAYRYFPSKRALVEGLLDRLGGLFVTGVRAIAADTATSRRDRLRRVLRMHLEFVTRTNGLPVLVIAEAAATGDAELVAHMRRVLDGYLDVLESLAADPVPGPAPLSPHDQALLLFALPAALAIRLRLGGDADAEHGIPGRLVPFVIRCLHGPEDESDSSRPGGAS